MRRWARRRWIGHRGLRRPGLGLVCCCGGCLFEGRGGTYQSETIIPRENGLVARWAFAAVLLDDVRAVALCVPAEVEGVAAGGHGKQVDGRGGAGGDYAEGTLVLGIVLVLGGSGGGEAEEGEESEELHGVLFGVVLVGG